MPLTNIIFSDKYMLFNPKKMLFFGKIVPKQVYRVYCLHRKQWKCFFFCFCFYKIKIIYV